MQNETQCLFLIVEESPNFFNQNIQKVWLLLCPQPLPERIKTVHQINRQLCLTDSKFQMEEGNVRLTSTHINQTI